MSGMCNVRAIRSCLVSSVLTAVRLAGIGEADWEFSTTFDASGDELNAREADLVFDGLDTFATVTLVRAATYQLRDTYSLPGDQNGKILTK